MDLSNINAVLLAVVFLIPGFIWSVFLSMFVPRRIHHPQVRFLEFLTLSCVNYGIWSGLISYFWLTDLPIRSPGWAAFLVFFVVFVSPFFLAVLTAALAQRDVIARLLRPLGFQTVHHIPTAWDWHFVRQQAYWMLVTLKDGATVFGYFGSKSLAGSDPENRDLYLERVHKWVNDTWVSEPQNYGMLILADQIATLEFYKVDGLDYDE